MKSLFTTSSCYAWKALKPRQIKLCSDTDLRLLSSMRELVSAAVGENIVNPDIPADSTVSDYIPDGWDSSDGINALFSDRVVDARRRGDLFGEISHAKAIENGVGYGFLVTRFHEKFFRNNKPRDLQDLTEGTFYFPLLDRLVVLLSSRTFAWRASSRKRKGSVKGVETESYSSALSHYASHNLEEATNHLNAIIMHFHSKGIYIGDELALIMFKALTDYSVFWCAQSLADLLGAFCYED